MRNKKVICLACGYLCFQKVEHTFQGETHPFGSSQSGWPQYSSITLMSEMSLQERKNPINWRSSHGDVICYRQLLLIEPEKKWTAQDRISEGFKDALMRPHDCKFYTEYSPGYKPEPHLELQKSKEQHRFLLITSLVSAAVGAGIATLANLVWLAR